MNNFLKKNNNKRIIILDIPLLMENKINKKNDILVFVEAKKKDINKRLKKRSKIVTLACDNGLKYLNSHIYG